MDEWIVPGPFFVKLATVSSSLGPLGPVFKANVYLQFSMNVTICIFDRELVVVTVFVIDLADWCTVGRKKGTF